MSMIKNVVNHIIIIVDIIANIINIERFVIAVGELLSSYPYDSRDHNTVSSTYI